MPQWRIAGLSFLKVKQQFLAILKPNKASASIYQLEVWQYWGCAAKLLWVLELGPWSSLSYTADDRWQEYYLKDPFQSTEKGCWKKNLSQTPLDTTLFDSTACTGWYYTISSFNTSTWKFVATFQRKKMPENKQTAPYANMFKLCGLEYNTDVIAQHQRLMSLGFYPFLHYSWLHSSSPLDNCAVCELQQKRAWTRQGRQMILCSSLQWC